VDDLYIGIRYLESMFLMVLVDHLFSFFPLMSRADVSFVVQYKGDCFFFKITVMHN
jgi:hypothetical protein